MGKRDMKRKTQVFIVHGGMTFRNHKDYLHFLRTRKISIEAKPRWTADYLTMELGRNFEIIRPRMPLGDNAKYQDWKIHFERHIPYLRNNLILIGTSLGGIFLAKYLSEHRFPKKILSTYLVCPPYDNSIPTEDLVGGFGLKSRLALLDKSSRNLYLMFSKDDDVVPVSHAEKFRKKLRNAHILIYSGKNGHFNVSEFPEIIRLIKSDVKRI
jgi:predicted alpha/beta hydrolase family esterase